jgi:hypothetical protein
MRHATGRGAYINVRSQCPFLARSTRRAASLGEYVVCDARAVASGFSTKLTCLMKGAAQLDGPFSWSVCYCLLTPFCTASGCLAVPVLFGPAAVPAPEVLASPPGEGLLAPVVPWFMVPVPSFIAPCDAPGPTLPWLDAPPLGWAV